MSDNVHTHPFQVVLCFTHSHSYKSDNPKSTSIITSYTCDSSKPPTCSSSAASSSTQVSKKVANCTPRFPNKCRDAPTTFKELRVLERASFIWGWSVLKSKRKEYTKKHWSKIRNTKVKRHSGRSQTTKKKEATKRWQKEQIAAESKHDNNRMHRLKPFYTFIISSTIVHLFLVLIQNLYIYMHFFSLSLLLS